MSIDNCVNKQNCASVCSGGWASDAEEMGLFGLVVKSGKGRVWNGLKEEICIFWRMARSYQGIQTLRHRECSGVQNIACSGCPRSLCVCEDGETEAGSAKEPGVSPEDIWWHQITLGRGVPDQVTPDSIFHENKLDKEWEVET